MCFSERSVLFFDSGIGGLTVLAECMRMLPSLRFLYVGDNANAPYGNLPPEKIRMRVLSTVERYADASLGALVLACNTATALCAEILRARYSFPVIGAEPAILPAVRQSENVWILATRATCESARLDALLGRISLVYPNARISKVPCDTLAGAIERGILTGQCNVTKHLPVGNPSTVVLGCTHYVYYKEDIRRFYGCPVFDGNEGIARRLSAVLGVKGQEYNAFAPSKVSFLGESAMLNKQVFEQMFASKNG